MGDPEGFYPVRPEFQADVPKARFKPKSGKTLSARRWNAAFSPEGYLDMAKVLSRIQRGGVHPSIKGEVWEFLLGCYDPHSSFDERTVLREHRREQYAMWKAVCQQMVPIIGSGNIITTPIISEDGQPIQVTSEDADGSDVDSSCSGMPTYDEMDMDKRVIRWKLILHQIGLDVVRTDRTLVFYENKENDAKLWNVLAVYAWVDRDIGYCQGMNDLCSPMVILLEHEADAFWCFEHLMRRMLIWAMEYNPNIFSLYQEDPDDQDGCSDPGSARLNDKLLKQYGKYGRKHAKNGSQDQQISFLVFLIASVLENKHKKLIKEAKGLDDVVKILDDITGSLDAKKACNEALKLHKKYLNKTKK